MKNALIFSIACLASSAALAGTISEISEIKPGAKFTFGKNIKLDGNTFVVIGQIGTAGIDDKSCVYHSNASKDIPAGTTLKADVVITHDSNFEPDTTFGFYKTQSKLVCTRATINIPAFTPSDLDDILKQSSVSFTR